MANVFLSGAPISLARSPFVGFVARRLLAAVGVLFVVSLIVFGVTAIIPGDAAQQLAGRGGHAATIQALRHQLGTDRSLVTQYLDWLGGIVRGHPGTSYISQRPIGTIIGEPLLNTAILALFAVVVAVPLAFAFGILSGLKAGRSTDHAISMTSLSLISLPDFVAATLLISVFAVSFGLVPPVSLLPPHETALSHPAVLVLPVATIALLGAGGALRMIRANVIDVMSSDYIAQARLAGISERRVVLDHAIRNGLAPSVQVIAYLVMALLAGIVVVETVFAYPGIGFTYAQAIAQHDVPLVQALSLAIGAMVVLINIVTDVVVILLVPKLRTNPL